MIDYVWYTKIMNENNGSQIQDILFRRQIVFGTVPIGFPGDMSVNLVRHINQADIILAESLVTFYQIVLDTNKFFAQSGYKTVEIKPKAEIYTYLPDDSLEYKDGIDQKIINESKKGKKVLVLSEEGYSNYMDPATSLKNQLVKHRVEFDTLHGPCMVIATIATSVDNPNDFIFAGNVQWWDEKEIEERLLLFKKTNMSIVFSFDCKSLKQSLNTINKIFPEYFADFCINLSKVNEEHIRGNLDKIINDHEKFLTDSSTDRYTLIISPNFIHRDKYNF